MRAGVSLYQHGLDLGEWMCGYQLVVDGQLSPMFDLHKSSLANLRTDEQYEQFLAENAENMIRAFGPANSQARDPLRLGES